MMKHAGGGGGGVGVFFGVFFPTCFVDCVAFLFKLNRCMPHTLHDNEPTVICPRQRQRWDVRCDRGGCAMRSMCPFRKQ